MAIIFSYEEVDFFLENEVLIKEWIKQLIESKQKEVGEINYIFVTDEKILEINQEYLKHDYYTDIITFDYCVGNIISGDLFISLETVETNAIKYNTTLEKEMNRVIVHGVLHLLGYTDDGEENKTVMRQEEDKALSIL